jgi:bifunctional DNA-binding transcriptional regulator/antitoxin component of YhaV-PrlF toxin-antitoxin module
MARVKRRRRSGFTRLSSKHQATIPVKVLAESGLEAGDELRVRADGPGRIVLEREQEWWEPWVGAIPGFMTQEELQELKREWDR